MTSIAFGVFIVLLMALYTSIIMFVLYPIVDRIFTRYQTDPTKKDQT